MQVLVFLIKGWDEVLEWEHCQHINHEPTGDVLFRYLPPVFHDLICFGVVCAQETENDVNHEGAIDDRVNYYDLRRVLIYERDLVWRAHACIYEHKDNKDVPVALDDVVGVNHALLSLGDADLLFEPLLKHRCKYGVTLNIDTLVRWRFTILYLGVRAKQ